MVHRQDASSLDHGAPTPGAVEALIERFGGLRPMADKLGVPVSTVQGWKKRGAIPATRAAEIRAAVARLNLDVSDADLDGVYRHDDAPPAAPTESTLTESAPTETAPAEIAAQTPAADSVSEPAPPEPVAPEPVREEPETVAPEPAALEPTVSAPAPVEPAPEEAAPATEHFDKPANFHKPVVSQEASVSDTAPQNSSAVSDGGGQGAGAAIAAAVLAVIGAAVSVTAPLWSHEYLQRSVNVAVIEKRTADLEAALKSDAAPRAALADRVGAVEKTLASLEARVARAPAVAGALAVRDLRAALAGGTPFAAEALAVRASGLLGADEEALLAALGPFAEKGVPTLAQINERFAWAASSAAGAGLVGMLPSVSSELPSRVWNWASGVATGVAGAVGDAAGSVNVAGIAEALRLKEPAAQAPEAAPAAPAVPAPAPAPVAEAPAPAAAAPESPSSAARLAEAAARLRDGDLAAAVAAVEKLEGAAAERTAAWAADARARLAADKLSLAVAQRAAKALQ